MSDFKKELMKITNHSRMLVEAINQVREKYPQATEAIIPSEDKSQQAWVVRNGDVDIGTGRSQWEAWQEAWDGIYGTH
jgi:hypothetical protein